MASFETNKNNSVLQLLALKSHNRSCFWTPWFDWLYCVYCCTSWRSGLLLHLQCHNIMKHPPPPPPHLIELASAGWNRWATTVREMLPQLFITQQDTRNYRWWEFAAVPSLRAVVSWWWQDEALVDGWSVIVGLRAITGGGGGAKVEL